MDEIYTHFNPVQGLLDLLQVIGHLTEQACWSGSLFVKNVLVNKQVKADKFNIGGHSGVNFTIVQLVRVQDATISACNIANKIFVGDILVIHWGHDDCRCVLDSLRLDHVLDNSAHSLSAFDKLAAEPLVGLSHVGFIKVVVTVWVGDTAHETVANSNQEKRVEH